MARLKYDPQNKIHQEALLHLYQISFPGVFPELTSSDYIKIGFQGVDPSTDFRGGGFFSLQQLIFFSENYSEEYETMKTAEYSFAISSINLSHFLCYFFQLFPRDFKGTSDWRRAPPRAMRTFARLNESEPIVIYEIHAMTAIKMDKIWKELRKKPGITVMDFMQALISATYALERVLNQSPGNVFELKKAFF